LSTLGARWRIVFMGTPGFACTILDALGHRPDPVVGVVCQPDRPRGRGLTVDAPAVKRLAEKQGLPIVQPERLRDPGFERTLRHWAPDLIVVAAYGKILPAAILALPPRGCINVHASLLPRHRGAAPIAWAILAGDRVTGVTIMAMNAEMDAGDVLLARETSIRPDDTTGTLTERLADLGAAALGEAIDGLRAGTIHPRPQPPDGITFAPRIGRDDARLDWTRAAADLERAVRAFAPAPGAFTTLAGRQLKVHRAEVVAGQASAAPGTVVHVGRDGLVVASGNGLLRLLELQLEGRRRLDAAAFAAGQRIVPGTCLGGP
jgi:methionyl-tRNA formyltransferase